MVAMFGDSEPPASSLRAGNERVVRIMSECFGQNFDRHIAPELGVMRLIDFTHAARADLRKDFVGAETCASGERHHFFPRELSASALQTSSVLPRFASELPALAQWA